MKLTKDEKETLKAWLGHPGYAIAKRYDEEQVQEIAKYLFKQLDLSKVSEEGDHLNAIRENQIAANAVDKYFSSLRSLTSEIIVPK